MHISWHARKRGCSCCGSGVIVIVRSFATLAFATLARLRAGKLFHAGFASALFLVVGVLARVLVDFFVVFVGRVVSKALRVAHDGRQRHELGSSSHAVHRRIDFKRPTSHLAAAAAAAAAFTATTAVLGCLCGRELRSEPGIGRVNHVVRKVYWSKDFSYDA